MTRFWQVDQQKAAIDQVERIGRQARVAGACRHEANVLSTTDQPRASLGELSATDVDTDDLGRSGENFVDDPAADIGKPLVATAVQHREAILIEAHEPEDRRMD